MKSLEAEVQRREKELQGMRYLLMNNTGSGAMRSPGRGGRPHDRHGQGTPRSSRTANGHAVSARRAGGGYRNIHTLPEDSQLKVPLTLDKKTSVSSFSSSATAASSSSGRSQRRGTEAKRISPPDGSVRLPYLDFQESNWEEEERLAIPSTVFIESGKFPLPPPDIPIPRPPSEEREDVGKDDAGKEDKDVLDAKDDVEQQRHVEQDEMKRNVAFKAA